jgi:hypothetical protein
MHARVRVTGVCPMALMRWVVSQFTKPSPLLGRTVVVVQAQHVAGVVDADEEGATVAVEEPGDGLDDGVFHSLVGLALPEVPAGGGLELDGEVLVMGDDFLDGSQRGAVISTSWRPAASRRLQRSHPSHNGRQVGVPAAT